MFVYVKAGTLMSTSPNEKLVLLSCRLKTRVCGKALPCELLVLGDLADFRESAAEAIVTAPQSIDTSSTAASLAVIFMFSPFFRISLRRAPKLSILSRMVGALDERTTGRTNRSTITVFWCTALRYIHCPCGGVSCGRFHRSVVIVSASLATFQSRDSMALCWMRPTSS